MRQVGQGGFACPDRLALAPEWVSLWTCGNYGALGASILQGDDNPGGCRLSGGWTRSKAGPEQAKPPAPQELWRQASAWSLPLRIGFRFAFAYLVLYSLRNPGR